MKTRRRFKQTTSLEDRLAARIRELREQADGLPPGPEKEALLRKLHDGERSAEVVKSLHPTFPGSN
ncbi:hypothetical protein [Bradyrhizobium sp. CCGUVB14]|uniref:hypothetical protein n=1 Tax=Bradyrhizobium sp. CCGUVB14 TaxID=2949628 RepID=UPI0020B28F70|nr:hypothetical protein [Bradyrhizobium sp. CCGUVB14]MCP3442345.1 hypothetical protein [Bradyrhizobium sp. CCGUVB14]